MRVDHIVRKSALLDTIVSCDSNEFTLETHDRTADDMANLRLVTCSVTILKISEDTASNIDVAGVVTAVCDGHCSAGACLR